MESIEKKTISKKTYFVSVIVLILINLVTLYLLYNASAEKSDLGIQKTALERDFKNLSDTLDVKKTEIARYLGKNAELDQTITQDQELLSREKKEIASLLHRNKLSQQELSKAKGMLAMYESSIAEMTKKLGDLTAQNEQLNNLNTDLKQYLEEERQTSAKLYSENKGLAKKVDAGSLLQLAKVDVEAIKTKHNGREVPVKRVKAAEELKISFETGGNKVLDSGTISLYVRIINPKGETIAVADQGSGIIPMAGSVNPLQYTKRADIEWDQKSKKVVLYWSQDIKDPGTYKVQVYQKGFVVGEGEVTLI